MDPTSPAVVVMMEEDNDRQASVQTPEDVSLFVQDLLQQMVRRTANTVVMMVNDRIVVVRWCILYCPPFLIVSFG